MSLYLYVYTQKRINNFKGSNHSNHLQSIVINGVDLFIAGGVLSGWFYHAKQGLKATWTVELLIRLLVVLQ